jgi:hypothetical protein
MFPLRLARGLSWIGHPLVFVSASAGVVIGLQLANRVGLAVLMTLLLTVTLPMALLLFHGVRSGRWSDADVSVRTERKRFYPRAIPISAGGVIALLFLHAPPFILRGAISTLLLLVLAGIANLRIKLSLHALFAFYCTVILFQVSPFVGGLALLLTFMIFWSRLYLRRHDWLEMLAGSSLGLIGGIAVVWWP